MYHFFVGAVTQDLLPGQFRREKVGDKLHNAVIEIFTAMKSTRKVVIVIISRQNVEIKCYVSLSLMNDIFLISIKKVN